MEDKIKCPNCHKLNDINKFCIYCGNKLLDEEEIKLILDNPEPYCLNCGRPVKIGQTKCECGYEFADIDCPKCTAKNKYVNKFCTSCGERLWKSNIHGYNYSCLFKSPFLSEPLPQELHNISVYRRSIDKLGLFDDTEFGYNSDDSNWQLGLSLKIFESKDSDADKNLYEICSRWRIVSPFHCISCLRISPGVCSCMAPFLSDEKRTEFLQNEKNYYIEPKFDNEELKSTTKSTPVLYLGSLAPAIGESQFEYKERLKLEFAANIFYKEVLKNTMSNINNTILKRKQKPNNNNATRKRDSKPSTINREPRGQRCDINCVHFFEEYILDNDGDGDYYDEVPEYYCELGRREVYNRDFCEYYNL